MHNFLRHNPGWSEQIKRGTSPLEVQYTLVEDATILRYVQGEQPYHNTPWKVVDYVYMLYNIGGCHWVLLMINLVLGQLLVWYSMISLTLDAELSKELDNMQMVFPALLDRVEIIAVKPTLPVTLWRLYRVKTTPQQSTRDDGGYFV